MGDQVIEATVGYGKGGEGIGESYGRDNGEGKKDRNSVEQEEEEDEEEVSCEEK